MMAADGWACRRREDFRLIARKLMPAMAAPTKVQPRMRNDISGKMRRCATIVKDDNSPSLFSGYFDSVHSIDDKTHDDGDSQQEVMMARKMQQFNAPVS